MTEKNLVMKIVYYLSIITLILSSVGCQKLEVPVTEPSQPVFFMDFRVNGFEQNLTAGIENYYMFTDFRRNEAGLHTFTGELREITCENACPRSLKIQIGDIELAPEGIININESLSPENNYRLTSLEEGEEDTLYQVFCVPDFPVDNLDEIVYSWAYDGGGAFVQPEYTLGLEVPIIGEICMTAQDPENVCNGGICKEIRFGSEIETVLSPALVIADTLTNQDSLRLAAVIPESFGDYNIMWSTGESLDTIGVNTPGEYSFTASSIGELGELSATVNISGDLTNTEAPVILCAPDFSVSLEREITAAAIFRGVTIEYIDESGVQYSSARSAQEVNASFFEINSVEEYERNERDLATALLQIAFRVNAQSEEGEEILLHSAEGSWGVSYPD